VPLSVHVLSVVCIVTSSKFDAYVLFTHIAVLFVIMHRCLVPPVFVQLM
jgi:hypothetical protein